MEETITKRELDENIFVEASGVVVPQKGMEALLTLK